MKPVGGMTGLVKLSNLFYELLYLFFNVWCLLTLFEVSGDGKIGVSSVTWTSVWDSVTMMLFVDTFGSILLRDIGSLDMSYKKRLSGFSI